MAGVSTRYYHGGPAGLTEILPPTLSGATSAKQHAAESGLDMRHVREDRVFICDDAGAAALFASSTATPTIYLVEPSGDLEPDPDCHEPETSWQCASAKVLASRRLTLAEIRRCRRVLFGIEKVGA